MLALVQMRAYSTALMPDAFPLFPHRHLLGIQMLSPVDIELLLERAEAAIAISRRPEKKTATLRGRTQINLFYEASTRTQSSFELAGKRLGADVMNMSVASSSVKKGETLIDTAMTLNAMRPDILIIRHQSAGAAALLAQKVGCSVVNAGDGAHEHPTQALLDALTIRRAKGPLNRLTVAICGDILHSRVARSNILLLNALGASVRVVAPIPAATRFVMNCRPAAVPMIENASPDSAAARCAIRRLARVDSFQPFVARMIMVPSSAAAEPNALASFGTMSASAARAVAIPPTTADVASIALLLRL